MQILWLSLFFALPFSASAEKIGLLKCRPGNAKETAAHATYFTKSKKWRGEHVLEKAEPNKRWEKRFATFDGRSINPVNVSSGYTSLKDLPGPIAKTCAWLKENQRLGVLLTSTRKNFSDPDGWKPADIGPQDVNLLEKIAEAYPACAKPAKPSDRATLGHFAIQRSYAANDGRRLVGIFSECAEVKDDALAAWDAKDQQPWSLWLFRTAKGKWTKQPNLDLIDIGDFDGDGHSEGVFFCGISGTGRRVCSY